MNKENFFALDMLRGVSALLVIFYHFFIFFFTQQTFSAHLLCLEPIDLSEPFYLAIINSVPIDIGHFGVAFFFLISGFFVQPSLEKRPSLGSFLAHKFFRLWPSYAFCFFIGIFCTFLFFLLLDAPFPYSCPHLFSSLFWMRDILHYPFIDGAVWTLEIQIKFYLVSGVIWYYWNTHFSEKMCLFSLFLSLVIWSIFSLEEIKDASWFYIIKMIRTDLKYFLLILLGTCTYSFYKKHMSVARVSLLCVLLILCFCSPLFKEASFSKTNGYLLGFIVFEGVVFFQRNKKKHSGGLAEMIRKISRMSYPLYVGHVLPGYTLMYSMAYYDLSVYWGVLIALPCVFVFAYFVHEKIEIPFIRIVMSNQKYQPLSMTKIT